MKTTSQEPHILTAADIKALQRCNDGSMYMSSYSAKLRLKVDTNVGKGMLYELDYLPGLISGPDSSLIHGTGPASHDTVAYEAYGHGISSWSPTWQAFTHCLNGKAGWAISITVRTDYFGGGMSPNGRHDNGYLSLASITEADARAEHEASLTALGADYLERNPESRVYYSHATPAGQLHSDAWFVCLTPPAGKRNARTLSFLIDVSICPDNSARMVRPASR